MNQNSIKLERLKRLGFSNPAESEAEYDVLFKRLQPVSPEYFTEPGRPPSLRDRATFDDIEYNRLLRQNQEIVKARFQGGTLAYVIRDEFEIFASAFCKPFSRLDYTETELYTVLNQIGPMEKKQLIEELDLKGPVVTKILQKFQKAFMVYELQPDKFGEQVWQTFESEWPEFKIDRVAEIKAQKYIIHRFISNMVTVDLSMVMDWTRFNRKQVSKIVTELISEGLIEAVVERNDTLYFCPEDTEVVMKHSKVEIPPSVYMVHKADYLYRAFESRLKEEYKGKEILQYLLIDGEFKGAIEGHWRIGPHDIDNIILKISDSETKKRKDEIISVVENYYRPPFSRILHYNGHATN